MGDIYTIGHSMPDLADAIQEWLPSEFTREWTLSTKKSSNEEFRSLWPDIDPNVMSLGTLSGWGWILQIYVDRVESFQVLPWGGEGTEANPLMAADPKFFEKLELLMHLIEDYRVRERRIRKLENR